MHDFQSFHKDSLMHFEAASVFCIHQIGKDPNRKNLGKVLVVLKSTIGACCNLIHYDIENIHLIVLVSMHMSVSSFSPKCNFLFRILFVALDSRLSSTATSVSKQPVCSWLSLRTACDNIQDSWKISADNFKFSNSRLKHSQCLKKI